MSLLQQISRLYNFKPGTRALSQKVNAELSQLVNAINGAVSKVNTDGTLLGSTSTDFTRHKSSGDHDNRYYRESEVDAMLNAIKGAGYTGMTLQNLFNEYRNLNNRIDALNATYSTDVERITAINQVIRDFENADDNIKEVLANTYRKQETYSKNEVDRKVFMEYNIGSGAITTPKLANSSVRADKIANGQIDLEHLSSELLATPGQFVDQAQVARIEKLERKTGTISTEPFIAKSGVTSYPPNITKGLFSPKVEGVKPIYNLYDSSNSGNFIFFDGSELQNDGYIKASASGSYKNIFMKTIRMIEDNSLYTILIHIRKNTLDGGFTLNQDATDDVYGTVFANFIRISGGKTGAFKYTVNSKTDLSQAKVLLRSFVNSDATTGEIEFRVLIVPGSAEDNTTLHYTEGFAPPAQNYDLVSRGKNKLDPLEMTNLAGYIMGAYANKKIDIREGQYYIYAKRKKAVPEAWRIYICITDTTDNAGVATANTWYMVRANNPINEAVQLKTGQNRFAVYTEGISKEDFIPLINEYFDLMLVEGTTAPSTYIPYTSSTATFTVPEEYPLVELHNGVKNVSAGDYAVNVKKAYIDLEDNALDKSLDTVDFIRVNKPADFVSRNTWMQASERTFYIEGFSYANDNSTIKPENIGGVVSGASLEQWRLVVKKDTYADIEAAKDALNGKVIYYQLATPITIKDGEQGYKAPTSIQAYENGDLVMLPKRIVVLDGGAVEYDVAPDKQLYPVVKGNLATNLVTRVTHLENAVTDLNRRAIASDWDIIQMRLNG